MPLNQNCGLWTGNVNVPWKHRISGSTLDLLTQNLHFNQILKLFICA